EVLGLKRTKAVEKKQKYEQTFQQRVNANPSWKAAYGSLLQNIADVYKEIEPYALARDYYTEIISKIELATISNNLNALVTAFEKDGENGYKQRLVISVLLYCHCYRQNRRGFL
ncbi:MAG: hypothetical protein EOP48_02565, partial [Sphingobacteriales bacterium]